MPAHVGASILYKQLEEEFNAVDES